MTLEIEVMYADLSRVRVPLDETKTLKRTGVLSIVLSAPREPRSATDRVMAVWDEDHYGVYVAKRYCALFKWGDKEMTYPLKLRATPFANPKRLKKPPGCLAPEGTLFFKGAQVDEETWAKACRILEDEMY